MAAGYNGPLGAVASDDDDKIGVVGVYSCKTKFGITDMDLTVGPGTLQATSQNSDSEEVTSRQDSKQDDCKYVTR
jgi:hypothetical protein